MGGYFLLNTAADAQLGKVELNMPDHDSKPYYFGITLGASAARFQTELHPHFLENDSVFVAEPVNSGGFTLGLSATTRLSNRFQLRFNPQLEFMERNIFYKLKYVDPIEGTTDVTKKVESVIMSFPIQIKLFFTQNSFGKYSMRARISGQGAGFEVGKNFVGGVPKT